jgi:ABC-2 type transport system permease protein
VFVALIAIPVVYLAAADLAAVLVAIIVSLRTSLGGTLWHPGYWLQLQLLWLYALFTSAIWFLPISGWLLVVSAWARRAVILWAILPPLGAILAERLFIGTHALGRLINGRLLAGYREAAFHEPSPHEWSMQAGDPATALESAWRLPALIPGFLASPETWIGALIGVALIALAIQLRARRAEAQ